MEFNASIKDELNFWDMITCDTTEWESELDKIHPNKYLRKVHKKLFSLTNITSIKSIDKTPERITSELLELNNLRNIDKVKEWIDDNWFSVEDFLLKGVGYCIKDEYRIISWSIMDCYSSQSAEIGIFTDEKYKGRGYGSVTAAATAEACLNSNFTRIGWHCIETNKGSNRIAEKIGFKEKVRYPLYSPFPPIENETDLSSHEWEEWALYYESIYRDVHDYSWLTAECWAKADNIDKTVKVCDFIVKLSLDSSDNLMSYFSENNAFRSFKSEKKWQDFLKSIS